MDDPRFMHVTSDPRYKRIPKKRHKVTVDNRFKSMFTDQRFKINYTVDKRGKKTTESSQENLKRYYNLEDDTTKEGGVTDSNHGDGDTENVNQPDLEKNDNVEIDGGESDDDGHKSGSGDDSDSSDNSDGGDDSDGSSTDLDYDALSKENEVEYDWGDLTTDVDRSHDTSHRLAVCNMNWDRITAQDLYVLFNSFKPQNGLINAVKIYLSDYGRERISKEDVEGPAELIDNVTMVTDDQVNPDLIEGQEFAREKLRQYQLNRLKYYYAVIECNDQVTAEHIYDQCDGMEYENSASTLDLRFVPSDTEFDHEPYAIATENSVASDFVPSNFFTSALQQTSVNLTWDETDPTRLKKTMKSFSKEQLENIDFSTYLASSSDEEDLMPAQKNDSNAYRAILGINESEEISNKEEEEELHITWSLGLKDEKKKKEKVKGNKKKVDHVEKEEMDNKDLGFDDPFFTQAVSTGKKKRKKEKVTSQEQEQIDKEKDELQLLMMSDDEETDKKHFNLKDITMEEQKESGKRKRRKRKFNENKTDATTDGDNFTVDTSDARFTALYNSHLYAVDPTNPQYKETKGMKEILSEKQKRSKIKRSKVTEVEPSSIDHSLGVLVKSVKAKALSYIERKKKKKQPLLLF